MANLSEVWQQHHITYREQYSAASREIENGHSEYERIIRLDKRTNVELGYNQCSSN